MAIYLSVKLGYRKKHVKYRIKKMARSGSLNQCMSAMKDVSTANFAGKSLTVWNNDFL